LQKIFEHQLVAPYELTSEIINGQRFYTLPDGVTKLKSVTTLLGEKLDKTSLLEWRKRVGDEEADKISAMAARRGSAIHNIAERYVLNEEDYIKNEMPLHAMSFKPIKKVLDRSVNQIRGIELPLYSKALGCAGRTDLVAEYNGELSVIDFKTSAKTKREDWIESYFLQSTLYSMMFERLYRMPVNQIVIIITVDFEDSAQVFVKNRANYVNRVLEVLSS
jgi:ATP-dependent exoDNAse (exonuclease V) beta subunit